MNLPQVALETVSANIQFVDKYSDTIKEWLEANTQDTGSGGVDSQGSGAGSLRRARSGDIGINRYASVGGGDGGEDHGRSERYGVQ